MNIRFCLGNDGHVYAVFADEMAAEKHARFVRHRGWGCFGGYMNALWI